MQESGGPVAFVLRWLDAKASGSAWAQAETDRQQLSLLV
ncbi:D-glycerate 2-kinase [Methylorubrum populi]|uniref:D-glycerate 2-kinase n=1 Tax=Methylorubrum populi TaxID=223967 RepID=A0A833J7X6_9HYPH|nr:D-glycerate 2-kinase [Methylorubrum populi]